MIRQLIMLTLSMASTAAVSAGEQLPGFSLPESVTTESARGGEFRNPVVSGFSPDPTICRVGDDFYMACSSFEYYPGVPVYHSRDLVNWELISYCLTTAEQLPLNTCRSSSGIYAPTLRYHDGLFYMITTNFAHGGEFYVTARDPRGPWSEPVWLHSMCADPSLLFDDDGRTYVVHPAGEGPRGGMIYLMELDLAKGAYVEGQTLPGRLIWTGTGGQYPEGPHLYKISGRYYLMIAEGGTGGDHRETIAVSDSPWGPYMPFENNPVLTHRDLPDNPISSTGHADMVQLQDGSWWGVSLGVRPNNGVSALGRETFLMPVEWTQDGWPIFGERRRVLMNGKGPALTRSANPARAVRDDFATNTPGLEWNYVRNPDPSRYSLAERPGWMRLKGAAASLRDHDRQTVMVRRQRDFDLRIATQMEFRPVRDGEEAGVVLRQTDELFASFGLVRKNGETHLLLRLAEPKQTTDLYDAPVKGDAVQLSVAADRAGYRFVSKNADGMEVEAGFIPAGRLAVEASWSNGGVMCFTGMMMGIYATGNGADSVTPADFDWFDYEADTSFR